MTVPAPPLRRHQREALAALDDASAADDRRSWIVLPPGAGKTRVGIDHALALLEAEKVGTVIAFGPNTAIQTQWASAWDHRGAGQAVQGTGQATEGRRAAPGRAGTDRELNSVFTALTYQSLAVFDEDRESAGSLLDELAPGGKALVDRLVDSGPLLLILDECHHLLEVWGSLLAELLDLLPEVWVLGLTATPPGTMTRAQRELVSVLFSEVGYSASIPAVVKEGDLAPFADLVWLTEPTGQEQDWLSAEAVHYTEFITSILDPDQGSIGFLEWVDRRFLGTRAETVSWESMRASVPELCDAALRLHHADLLHLPPGARVGEQHRRDPDIDDWARLIDDWMRHHLLASQDPRDRTAAEAIRRALPAIGYRWTRHGIRPGRSPVDRVIARSASKPAASADIVSLEAAELGERLRMLVLCDVESATATLSAEVGDVISESSGSAQLVLETLIADPRTLPLRPLLMTGRTVAGAPEVLTDLLDSIAEDDAALAARLSISEPVAGVSRLEGGWTSRTWVPLVTECFSRGQVQVLIGTRALLGEGWDAPAVTGMIDLSTATTPTAVTQTRGRALRQDPHWSEKVALNWTVVCVSTEHPRGDQDWGRLVRKHDGFFGTDADGEVVDGVAHIDPAFSAFAPPDENSFAVINARMSTRAQARTEVADRWDVGADYRDEELRSVRILTPVPGDAECAQAREDSAFGCSGGSADLRTEGLAVTARHLGGDPGRLLPFGLGRGTIAAGIGIGLFLILAAILGSGILAVVVGALATVILIALPVMLSIAGARRRRLYARPPTVSQLAGAIAEALHEVGLSTQGAEAVRVRTDARGDLRCHLDAEPESAEAFALALDEAVSAIADPRYLLPCWHLPPRRPGVRGWWDELWAGAGTAHQREPAWHAVPSALGANRELARAYAAAWDRWVGGGETVYTRRPTGAGILAAVRSTNPLELTSVLRTTWR